MALKRLIIIRHGPADRHGFLTPEGFTIIDKLTASLQAQKLIDDKTWFICSDQLRTLKTAQRIMIKAEICTDEMMYDELFSLEKHIDIPGALRVIGEHVKHSKAETLVVVTHLEMVEQLPHAFGEQVLRASTPFPSYQVHHGEGFVIDCEKKTCELLEV